MSSKSGNRFCKKDMLKQEDRAGDDSKKSHPALAGSGETSKVSVKHPCSSTERLHAFARGALQAILPVRSQHTFERATVLGDFAPLRYCALVLLDMILNSIGLFADQECLNRALFTFSQLDCMAWKLRDFGAVPLEHRECRGHSFKQGCRAAGIGELDLKHTDLRLGHQSYFSTERGCEQLVSQTDAKKRCSFLVHPLPNGDFFESEPRMPILLPDIHRPSEDYQGVIAFERRDGSTLVELDRIPWDAIGTQEIAKHAGMLYGRMLEHQKSHGVPSVAFTEDAAATAGSAVFSAGLDEAAAAGGNGMRVVAFCRIVPRRPCRSGMT